MDKPDQAVVIHSDLSLIWENVARPVILLTKAELSGNLDEDLTKITSAAMTPLGRYWAYGFANFETRSDMPLS